VRVRDVRCASGYEAAQRILRWCCFLSVVALVFACLDRSVQVVGSSTTTTVLGILITPAVATLNPGDHVQFQAKGVTQAGDSVQVVVTWAARYGRITPDGLYTAPASGQKDVVTATASGTALVDSVVINLLPVSVGSVVVRPSSATLVTGQLAQLMAAVLSSNGDTLNRPVVWSTSDPTVAGISPSGVVSAKAPGSSTITAANGGEQGASAITVVAAPPPGEWPHEPSSYALVADEPWSILAPVNWILEFGTAAISLDGTAPESPPFVLQFTYPAGMPGGAAPGTMEYPLSGQHQLFVGMWWKPSNPWQGHITGSNKIQYAFTNEHGSITMVMYGPVGGPYELRVFPQFSTSSLVWLTPNVATVPVQLGVWHRIEWQVIYSSDSTTPNGICRWWLDGTLVGDYENLVMPAEGLAAYKIAPVWGGVSDVKQETDFYWIDHVHISAQ